MGEKKVKILYCITKANMGGAQKYVHDLAISLPKETYNTTVLIGNDGPLNEKLTGQGIRTIILGDLNRNVHFFSDIRNFFKILKIFRQENPEIIHLNSSKMGLLGVIAGRLSGIPKIIFTGHGWAFNEERNFLQKKVIYLLHLLTITLSHKTIAVSEQTKNQIAKNNFLNKKIRIIRNGLAEPLFIDKQIARKEISAKLPISLGLENRPWLGTISELHKNKGLRYIIEAMHIREKKNSNKSGLPVLIIIGEGEEREELQKKINEYSLTDSIFLIGRIDEAQKYLTAFDIFTLTSITEALPYAVLEAGLAGLPIIASAVGGIPEIINDMKNGVLVRPGESNEIERAIDFLLNNPAKMSEFGQQIKIKIKKEFNQEKMLRETMSTYQEK